MGFAYPSCMRALNVRAALKWIAGLVLVLLVVLALFITFGLNTLRGPITRAVTEATGRTLLIEGDLKSIWSWTHPRFRAEKISFANPAWATEAIMVSAEAVEASVSLLGLLRGRVVVPEVHLESALINLEQDAKGQRNWILDRDQKDEDKESRVHIELLTLDNGQLNYDDAGRDISIQADLNTDETGIVFATTGTYQGLSLTASGHAGQVLSLRDTGSPFPLKVEATGPSRSQPLPLSSLQRLL